MTVRYFAYGSNLKLARMRSRVPEAVPEGVARLDGYRLRWDKRGGDGSGKANVAPAPAACVWGVVYAFPASRWPDLDAHEGGYERVELAVARGDTRVVASTYVSALVTTTPPFAWYKRLVVEGAREHGLPADWQEVLSACETLPDPEDRSG